MAPPIVLEKPVKVYTTSDKLLKYIALNGNYQDVVNALTLVCQYESIFTTGIVNTIKKVRGGNQASAVAALEATLTGATVQTNSIQDFNNLRHNFLIMIAITKPAFYASTSELHDRMCIYLFPEAEDAKVLDCQGNTLGIASNINQYLTLWNTLKVPADLALCGINPGYMTSTFTNEALYHTTFNFNNDEIAYNAPAVQNHSRRGEFDKNRSDHVDNESQVKPKSLSTFSDKEF